MNSSSDNITRFCNLGKEVLKTEAKAIEALIDHIDESFAQACQYILDCRGRVVVLGMGKSGHIGNKIAATLASTGTPAFFVHPAEASHGDMGMITAADVVIAISYTGETQEILLLLPLIKRLGINLISITGKPHSNLAKLATVNLNVAVSQEACPLGLAPTSSTTATLAMGDALAIALLQTRGFTADDFALSHPGGSLGKRLLLHVADIMHTGNDLPCVEPDITVSEALVEMTHKRLGMTMIVGKDKRLLGVFTDGDLRRAVNQELNLHEMKISELMHTNPKTIAPHALAAEGLRIMQVHKITSLVVMENDHIEGVIHLHDLLQNGVI